MKLLNKDEFIEFMNSALGDNYIIYVNAIDRDTVYIGAKNDTMNYSIKVNLENEFTEDKLYINLKHVDDLIHLMKEQLQKDAKQIGNK